MRLFFAGRLPISTSLIRLHELDTVGAADLNTPQRDGPAQQATARPTFRLVEALLMAALLVALAGMA